MAAPTPVAVAVTGGTIYVTSGLTGEVATTFVPSSAGGLTRYVKLVETCSDAGVSITATPGSGAFGITRTAGTSLVLTGEATSGAAAKTDKAVWEITLPDSYVSGSNISVTVNCNTSGTVITAASTTMTVAAYTEVAGVETLLTVSAAQQIPATATGLVFTITGTGLVAGMPIALELVQLVTTASGAGTGIVNSVSYVA